MSDSSLMAEPDWTKMSPINAEERRFDRQLAELAGWYVKDGCLFSPSEANHGGSYLVHSGKIKSTPEIVDNIWYLYCPHFSTRIEYAVSLLNQTNVRWTLRGYMTQYWCFIGGMDGAQAETAALAVCRAWLQFIEFQRSHKKQE